MSGWLPPHRLYGPMHAWLKRGTEGENLVLPPALSPGDPGGRRPGQGGQEVGVKPGGLSKVLVGVAVWMYCLPTSPGGPTVRRGALVINN